MVPSQLLAEALAGNRGAAVELGRLLDSLAPLYGPGASIESLFHRTDQNVLRTPESMSLGGNLRVDGDLDVGDDAVLGGGLTQGDAAQVWNGKTLTAAKTGTLPVGSAAAGQVPFWLDANELTGNGNLTFDGTTLSGINTALGGYGQLAAIATPATPSGGAVRHYAHTSEDFSFFVNDRGAAIPAGVAAIQLPILDAFALSATLVTVATHHRALNFADAADQNANWFIKLPAGWGGRTITMKILWSSSGASLGNVIWKVYALKQITTTALSNAADVITAESPSAGINVTDRPVAHTLPPIALSGVTPTDGQGLVLGIQRTGTSANDTHNGLAARLLAAELSIVG